MEKGDVIDYIASNLKRGLSLEEVKQGLLLRGVSDFDIENSFHIIDMKNREAKKL